MPQLVKGGKQAYGWSSVGSTGRIVIPPEALKEYCLRESEKLILLPGSRTSGGFAMGSWGSLGRTALKAAVDVHPELGELGVPEGEIAECRGKPYCWVQLRDGGVTLPPGTLNKYGVGVGDKLLVIRGSGLAVGFVARGPIVKEAERHPELEVFEPPEGEVEYGRP